LHVGEFKFQDIALRSRRHDRCFDGRRLVLGDFHAHFHQRFLLDLPDALARDAQPVADFLQRFGPAVIQPEPHGQNPVFPRRERGQNFPDQRRVVLLDQPVKRICIKMKFISDMKTLSISQSETRSATI
jgi:hypothetical protein